MTGTGTCGALDVITAGRAIALVADLAEEGVAVYRASRVLPFDNVGE